MKFTNTLNKTTIFINFLLILFSLFVLNLFSSISYAAPAPNAPNLLYRADTRKPDDIFGTKFTPGPGFVTWAAARGVPENPSIVDYLSGVSVTPAPEGNRNAGWVSATGSLLGVLQYLDDELVRRGTPPVALQEYWVYEIAPSADGYSVNWMLDEAAATPESRTNIASIMSLLGYRTENEWIIRGGVPQHHIRRAVRYRYRYDITTGLGGYDQDFRPGSIVDNPNYNPPARPSPHQNNPMLAEQPVPIVFGYNYGGGQDPLLEDSMDEFDDFAFSCAGTGASGFGNMKMASKAPPPAPGCDYSLKSVKKYTLKDLPTVLSKLVIGYTSSQNLCLSPTNARTSSLYGTRSYLYADSCEKGNFQNVIYDSYQRIAFPNDYFGVPVCVTAPENVISGTDSWDWIQLWPCDIKNPYQKWVVAKGKMRPLLNLKLAMQLYKYYGIVSKNSGPEITLNTSKIPKEFFNRFSRPTTTWYEIGMSFNSPQRYYPNSAYIYAGTNYNSRTYYDIESQRLWLLEFYERAFQSSGWQLKCLYSDLGWWSWNWADWGKCSPYVTTVPDSQKWLLKTQQSTNPITNVLIKGKNNNGLYVNLSNSMNWGRLFSANAPISPSTHFFDIHRVYGVCLNPDKSWYQCNQPKHSTSENDG